MEELKKMLSDSLDEANKLLATAAGSLARNGLVCVHVVCAGHEDDLRASAQSGKPTEEGDDEMFPLIAWERALKQVETNPRPTGFVPQIYVGRYPNDPGSAVSHNVCVGVACDKPQNARLIAELYATLVYEFFVRKMTVAGMLDKAA